MLLKKYLLKTLKKNGVKNIYGVPGRENEKIQFNEVDGIDFITTRVEYTASIAGDVSGRISNKTQVVFSTMGPGATNLTTGIASAMLNRSPVIYLTSQLESDDLHYNMTHQCVDQKSIFEPITKYSTELKQPDEIIEKLKKAFIIANTEPCGPVHLSIPTDFFESELGTNIKIEKYKIEKGLNKEVDGESIKKMKKLFHGAKNPICLVGSEVNREEAFDEVLNLAKSWNIPFITSANVKGISDMFKDDLNLGSASCYMEGIINFPALDFIFEESDVIILIGYQYVDDLLPKMWERGLKKKVVLINLMEEPWLGEKLNIECCLFGSLKKILPQLSTNAQKLPCKDYSVVKNKLLNIEEIGQCDTLSPFQVMNQVNKFMDNGIMVTDIGYYRHHAILFSHTKYPFSFISDTGISSFGSGLPSAIAAKVNFPDKDVFLVCGDGGFHSGSGDLATLVKYNLPIVIIIMNNSSFELINLYQHKNKDISDYNNQITSLAPVNFVKLAEANYCDGVLVRNEYELLETLENWTGKRPLIIETKLEYKDKFEVSF